MKTRMKPTGTVETKVEVYWTIHEVAARLHQGVSTVKRKLTLGELRKTKSGRRTLIAEKDLQSYLQKSTEEHQAAA